MFKEPNILLTQVTGWQLDYRSDVLSLWAKMGSNPGPSEYWASNKINIHPVLVQMSVGNRINDWLDDDLF
jgi:hypothetical protein